VISDGKRIYLTTRSRVLGLIPKSRPKPHPATPKPKPKRQKPRKRH
jgi:hypothetical protein